MTLMSQREELASETLSTSFNRSQFRGADVCCRRTGWQHHTRPAFAFLAVSCIVFASSASALQEHVLRTRAVQYPTLVSLTAVSTHLVMGALHVKLSGETRRAKWSQYLLVSLCSYSGILLTNNAVQYVDYTTRLVFKSTRILPVMIVSSLFVRKTYSARQWLAASILVVGLVMFSLDDGAENSYFHPKGLALILLAVTLDALTGNLEEAFFFNRNVNCAVCDVIYHTSMFGFVIGIISMPLTIEDGREGILFLAKNHWLLLELLVCSLFNYVSISLILLIISDFGATEAEVIKCLRRISSIVISITLFGKRLSALQLCALVAVAASFALGLRKSRHDEELGSTQ